MKITSFLALSATALLSLPAFAQQAPPRPPSPPEETIILLDDADIEMDMDVDIDPRDAAEIERLVRSRVMMLDSIGAAFEDFDMDFDFDFDFNAEQVDSPEAEKRAELRDRYEDLRDQMRSIQRDVRQRQRELRAARRSGSADTVGIQGAIESAEQSLASARQSLETFQKQYGDQLGRTFWRSQAPIVRFRRNGADSEGAMRLAPLPPMPPMPPMPNMENMPPIPPMPPMPPMPRLNGSFSHGGNLLRFDGDTMIVRNSEGRQVIIIRDSTGNNRSVIVNSNAVGGGEVRVRSMSSARVDGGAGGSTVIINGDTVSNTGSAHVVVITRNDDGEDVTVDHSSQTEMAAHDKPAGTTDPSGTRYALQEAVPNPLTRRATISFSLPSAAPVSLVVFNESGQKVRTLVDSQMSAGTHSVEFDATDLPTGLYLYQLISGGYSQTRSMRVVK